ncbi:hypothetical protein TREMEDRAFT_61186 [Tremella mesenterica DSM 1558]|uniref:uncharacterized protein n=1 Tax=Tremella mesenterica (strain ATCC 24925 / CBS 8224 / DSM 1558 / NBRC 9311 / NRRL Y-6157 / RJB 2259-6 / UBC 559-6) TaxID=578456 RepID=UPI0003F48D58|nr:uncharacterized protein TREMEDRAFT_61186 [Tremella mesenterica DSM 1558]EIW70679.1 hypothetical protein TREMEDRAFT_61186 [Tremella mesenterica DSM 1558]
MYHWYHMSRRWTFQIDSCSPSSCERVDDVDTADPWLVSRRRPVGAGRKMGGALMMTEAVKCEVRVQDQMRSIYVIHSLLEESTIDETPDKGRGSGLIGCCGFHFGLICYVFWLYAAEIDVVGNVIRGAVEPIFSISRVSTKAREGHCQLHPSHLGMIFPVLSQLHFTALDGSRAQGHVSFKVGPPIMLLGFVLDGSPGRSGAVNGEAGHGFKGQRHLTRLTGNSHECMGNA